MPQFELEDAGPDRFSGLVRGLDLPDAVRRALALPAGADVTAGPSAGAEGWQEVRIAGAPAGRGRPHQRMRFRRD
jgi:hypothetical protein